MSANFELANAESGAFTFRYVDSNGETLLLSGEHPSKAEAEQAIQGVRVGSLMSQQIAKGKTPEGQFFFVIKDNAGTVLAKSVLFENEMVFDNALHQVKDKACIAAIAEV